jgi:hypothetical protein
VAASTSDLVQGGIDRVHDQDQSMVRKKDRTEKIKAISVLGHGLTNVRDIIP